MLQASLPAGTNYELELSLVMGHTTNVDVDIEAIGQRALKDGKIVL